MSNEFEGQSSFLAARWRLQERVELNLDRFDERGKETGMLPNGPATAPFLDSTPRRARQQSQGNADAQSAPENFLEYCSLYCHQIGIVQ